MSNKTKKVIIYSFLLVPFFIIISELSLAIITILFDIDLPNKKIIFGGEQGKKYDLITGSNVYKKAENLKKLEKSFVDRHGLIKTTFTSYENNKKSFKGIAISGNSVALGYPLTHQGNYKKKNIVTFKDDTLKINKKHMIKLNSILDYLINY